MEMNIYVMCTVFIRAQGVALELMTVNYRKSSFMNHVSHTANLLCIQVWQTLLSWFFLLLWSRILDS